MQLFNLSYMLDNGRPSAVMTDEAWQEIFKLMKSLIEPSKQKRLSKNSSFSSQSKMGLSKYHGDTINQARIKILNDNLDQIRRGNIDYVYYTYNIAELLKYEHERLRSRYNQKERYFEIWLEVTSTTHCL